MMSNFFGAYICICRESQCLPYARFLTLGFILDLLIQLKPKTPWQSNGPPKAKNSCFYSHRSRESVSPAAVILPLDEAMPSMPLVLFLSMFRWTCTVSIMMSDGRSSTDQLCNRIKVHAVRKRNEGPIDHLF